MDNSVVRQVANAFLTLDGETVYEITPNSVVNIGRLEGNDVVLDDYKVSREHAVLKFSNDTFTLVDLASTHGTYVNGERIDRCPVKFGDKIEIVSHELILSSEIPEELKAGEGIQPAKLGRGLDRRLKFFGGLNEFALITLVQFLAQEKQSGLLLLEAGPHAGPRLYFQDGEIIHVADGEDLADLLTRQNHDESLFFYFHHETHFPVRTIHEETAQYLMRLCQSHDERKSQKAMATAFARSTSALAVTSKIRLPPEAT